MTASTQVHLSVEDYLNLEKNALERHEYVDGVLHAMAGDKKRNNRIVRRIVERLGPAVDVRECDLFFTVVKVCVAETRYRYPDVVVTCEEDADEYLVIAPCAIFEVLSDSTEKTDTEDKLEEYLKIPSLERYVLVRQESKTAIVYARDASDWRVNLLEEQGDIEIPCLGMVLKLEDLYERPGENR